MLSLFTQKKVGDKNKIIKTEAHAQLLTLLLKTRPKNLKKKKKKRKGNFRSSLGSLECKHSETNKIKY